jgi:cytochrome c oxidase assembly protein subunit 15
MRKWIIGGISVLLIQIIYGAFVAGLKAGLLHNHWPLMNEGAFMHYTVYLLEPFYKNLIENPSGIQFVHRTLAYIVVLFVIIIWFKSRQFKLNSTQKFSVNILVFLVIMQFTLGVYTILHKVPISLGLAHQIGAFFLISAMVFTLHRFSK